MNFARMRNAIVLAAATVGLASCGINSVPAAEENAKAKWADVESAYQRRADLIPNLVSTVKGFATQEQDVLTQVTEARSRATSVNIDAGDLSDPDALRNYSDAQGALGNALDGMRVVYEAYPQLTSSQNFIALQSQLEGTENRINVARRDYNEAVRAYNTTIRTFPDTIGANLIHGAEPMVPFEASSGADQSPTVNFDDS